MVMSQARNGLDVLLISVNGLPCFEKNLLGQVLCIGNIAHPVINVPVNPVNIHVIQPPEGIGIASDSPLDKNDFRNFRFGMLSFLHYPALSLNEYIIKVLQTLFVRELNIASRY